MLNTQHKIGIFIILLLYLSLGLGYSYYTPLWNPPDEERHFAYCEYIAQNYELPRWKSDREEFRVTEGFQPPLYYLIASLFCKNDKKLIQEILLVNDEPGFSIISHPEIESEFPYAGKARTAHLLRFFSLALSVVNIYLIYLLVLKIFPGEMILASATSLFVAMNPQFLHISASISNENLSSTLSTLYLFVLLRYVQCPLKVTHHIITGALLGCCLLSKISTIFYLPVTGLVIIWVYLRDIRKLMGSLFLVFCTAALVAGWWFLRNLLLYNDPFLSNIPAHDIILFLGFKPFSLSYVTTIVSNTFVSFCGNFGSLQIPIPTFHLSIYGCIIVFGIAGICRLLVKREMTVSQIRVSVILLLSLLGGVGIFVLLNLKYVAYQGRYLFVVIAPIAIFTCVGLRSLFPHQWRKPVLMALSLLLIFLNLDIFFRVLKPAYAETLLVAGVTQPLFSYPAREITRSTTIGQTFVSPRNNLCALRVMFSCGTSQKNGEITFSLKEEEGKGEVLRQINVPLEKVDSDTIRYFFIFPPIKDSMGKEYMFCFSSPSLPPGSGVSLWCELSDCYHGGVMHVNGEPADGALYFNAYYFTGEEPTTDWQGKREIAISQGQYVSIRERQLYYERSKSFSERTITHRKLIRLERALNNKMSLTKQGK